MTCVRDIIATSGLAFRVHATYKDTPHYKHISEDVASLQVLIDKAAQHFKSDTITSDDRHYGQKVLKGCQGVLGELNSFIDKYKRLASMNKMLVLNRMKLGKEDITTLQVRLVSNTGLLNGFVRSCEYKEVQAQLATLLGLHRINSGISVTSIASFAANTNTETAYKNLCKELCQIGVTEDMIRQKEDKILEILRSQDMVTSSQIGDRDIGDRDIGNEDQVLEMAYTEYCKDLYRIGFTDDMILQQKDKILGILRSRGVVSSQTCGSSNIGDKDIGDKGNSSAEVMPSFRLSLRFRLAIDGDNPALLHLAADNSHFGTIGLLCGKGAPIDQENNTLLHCAVEGSFTETVKLLLEKGAPVEAANRKKNTPLHLAAKSGHAGIVDLLLKKGAPVEAVNKGKNTPLHLAASNGDAGVVQLLLTKGASPNTGVWTPLHYAVLYGHTDVVQLLLEKGASPKAKDGSGWTPLNHAVSSGHISIVRLLLEKGALPNAKDYGHRTPLHHAASNGHTGVVQLLLEKGVSFTKDCCGQTPLHHAASGGHTGVVQLLLEKGASHSTIDSLSRTPVHDAAYNGHTGVVQLLLEEGASPNGKDALSYTPLGLAKLRRNKDIIQLLKKAGAW